jgi:hypothetical protein
MPVGSEGPPRRAERKGVRVKRSEFDLRMGYQYYVFFKPGQFEQDEVRTRVPVEAAISVSETGELADATLELPKYLHSEQALQYIRLHENVTCVPPRLFVVVPERAGDAVLIAVANLDVDLEGRILGMEIHWSPAEEAALAE